jgi:hypothetical protein
MPSYFPFLLTLLNFIRNNPKQHLVRFFKENNFQLHLIPNLYPDLCLENMTHKCCLNILEIASVVFGSDPANTFISNSCHLETLYFYKYDTVQIKY